MSFEFSMCKDIYIPRSALSDQIAAKILSASLTGTATCQIWSSARHTGKRSFFQKELKPKLKGLSCHVISIDLWAKTDLDPGMVLAKTLNDELAIVRDNGSNLVDELPFSWITINKHKLETPGRGRRRGGTLSEVLQEIAKYTADDIVLIVNEAQQSLETAAGCDAMAALRSAFDEMNGDGTRLHLVLSGSHRDRLSALVSKRKAPFIGVEIQEFPRLGRSFVEELVHQVNTRLAADNQLSSDDVTSAFTLLGFRPGILAQVVQDHALGQAGSAGLHQTVTARAGTLQAMVWQQHQDDYGTLTEIQRAVLLILIEDGSGFSPFAAKTLDRIGERMGEILTPPKVQKALDGLRDRGIVWRPGRGSYALEDQDMRDWVLRDTKPRLAASIYSKPASLAPASRSAAR